MSRNTQSEAKVGRTGRAARCGRAVALGLVAGACVGLSPAASAQPLGETAVQRRTSAFPQRETAARLLRTVPRMEFTDTRLEDAVNFVRNLTGADIDVAWVDEKHTDGLEKDMQVSMDVTDQTALEVIEILLERAEGEFSADGNAWQFNTKSGALEIGPKSRLNKKRRVEVYAINDMLTELPTYDNAPDFDLNQILQSSRGGGGQSPFQNNDDDDIDRKPLDEKVQEIVDIIQEIVEPTQWVDNGGDAASIRYWQGNLIVNAPDYVHRGINGYPWWPARSTVVSARPEGTRWVTLNQDSNIAAIEGIAQQPVSAVVNGRIVRSDEPGGGG
ncbi:MAG: hypothetical protein IT439_09265 [Phycisphaerales bacterium]|nr:hypothetical protein [Phycisphaerales bacterium]